MKRGNRWRALRQSRRGARNFRRRIQRRHRGKAYGRRIRANNRPRVHSGAPRFEKELSGDLDILRRPTETIAMLEGVGQIPASTKKGVHLHIKMDEVTSIDAPSLLYFCSRLRWLNDRKRTRNTGSYPKHKRALQALRDGGFESFLTGRLPSSELGPPILALVQGSRWDDAKIRPGIPTKLQYFLAMRNPEYTEEERFYIYLAVIECLENVGQHAYSVETKDHRHDEISRRGWYAVGLFDESTRTTTIAILDQGIGIVASTKRNIGRLGLIGDYLTKSPADILELATSGLRTETREDKRGRGLRSLRDFARAAPGRRFHVLSSGAMVTWTNDGVTPRTIPAFEGTIVCLEMTSPPTVTA